MRFYFAGSFTRGDELRRDARYLMKLGHEVTARWLFISHEADTDDLSPDGDAFRFATEDLEDLTNAHVMIAYSSRDHTAKGRGGRHVEFGYMLALRRVVFLIGRRENAFHALIPDSRVFPTFDDFIESSVFKYLVENHVEYGTTSVPLRVEP